MKGVGMMEQRVNKVKELFGEFFGLSPDVIYYENGKIEAFRIISKDNCILMLVVQEYDYKDKSYNILVRKID
jgi:hypothetical protein